MAIAFSSNRVGPHIVADTTVIKMFSRDCAAMDPAVLATLATALESQTMTAGAASFATAVDGRQYLFVCGTGATAKTVILGNSVANQQTATLATNTPEARRIARRNLVGGYGY
jgi:hypothetical protein